MAFAVAVAMLYGGLTEWLDPAVKVAVRPRAVPPLVMGTVMLLATIGNLRAIRVCGRLAGHATTGAASVAG